MHVFTRLAAAGFFTVLLTAPAWSKTPAPKEAEYSRADQDFYLRGDVVRADPGAVILPETAVRQAGDSYFFQPKVKAPKELYLRETKDWLEPITPPDMPLTPEGLGIKPDEMQIREMQGDVQVALPASATTFAPASDGETIPDGAIVKTGANGTAAILLGGVNSVRLTPNSQASVEQTVTPDLRTTKVDLQAGGVFSKVGMRPKQKQDFEVRTPFGTALAKGTDFLTVVATHDTGGLSAQGKAGWDVFVAQGTVEFVGPDGKRLAEARSNGKGELQAMEGDVAGGAKGISAAALDDLTMAFHFIPTVNLKIKALQDKEAGGTKLTAQEKTYLSLIHRIPVLIKLALVPPPAPPLPPVVATPPPPPTPAPSSVPLNALLHVDGTVDFQGKTLTAEVFKAKLEMLMKVAPHKVLVLHASNDVPLETIRSTIDMGRNAGLKKVTLKMLPPKKTAAATPSKPVMKATPAMAPRAEAVTTPEPTTLPAPSSSGSGDSSASMPGSPVPTIPDQPLPDNPGGTTP